MGEQIYQLGNMVLSLQSMVLTLLVLFMLNFAILLIILWKLAQIQDAVELLASEPEEEGETEEYVA